MAILHLGLALGAAAFLYVGWASWNAGYGPEIAVVRGLIAFMAVTFVGYIGELIIATAPPPRQRDQGDQPAAEPPTSITSLRRARDDDDASADGDASAPADSARRAA